MSTICHKIVVIFRHSFSQAVCNLQCLCLQGSDRCTHDKPSQTGRHVGSATKLSLGSVMDGVTREDLRRVNAGEYQIRLQAVAD